MNPIHVFKLAVTVNDDCEVDAISVANKLRFDIERDGILHIMQLQEQGSISTSKATIEMKG